MKIQISLSFFFLRDNPDRCIAGLCMDIVDCGSGGVDGKYCWCRGNVTGTGANDECSKYIHSDSMKFCDTPEALKCDDCLNDDPPCIQVKGNLLQSI